MGFGEKIAKRAGGAVRNISKLVLGTERKFRKDIFEQAASLGEYVYEKKPDNVIFLDASARPAMTALRDYLRGKYPGFKRPHMFALNPLPFRNGVFTEKEIIEKLKKEHPHLFERSGKKTLLFDTCVHSGKTVRPVLRVLQRAGFDDMSFAIASTAHLEETARDIEIDHSGPDIPRTRCYPFGREMSVQKNDTDLVLHKKHYEEKDDDERKKATREHKKSRQRIARAITEGLKKNS